MYQQFEIRKSWKEEILWKQDIAKNENNKQIQLKWLFMNNMWGATLLTPPSQWFSGILLSN